MRSALHESLADAIPTYINIGSSNGTLGTVEVRDCVINVGCVRACACATAGTDKVPEGAFPLQIP